MNIELAEESGVGVVGWEIQFGKREGKFAIISGGSVFYKNLMDKRLWHAGNLATPIEFPREIASIGSEMTTAKAVSALCVAAGLLMSTCANGAPQGTLELRPDAPRCTMPKAALPKLGVDRKYDKPTEIKADFNGDGWCDYALGVPYPFNSRMNAYDLNQLMVLGKANGWKPVFKGKRAYELREDGVSYDTLPTFRIDLTDIRLVFPAQQGAPFVLGLFAGYDEGTHKLGHGCHEYSSVYRWDDALGTFRKADDATRGAVLHYFYSVIEKPCGAKESA